MLATTIGDSRAGDNRKVILEWNLGVRLVLYTVCVCARACLSVYVFVFLWGSARCCHHRRVAGLQGPLKN